MHPGYSGSPERVAGTVRSSQSSSSACHDALKGKVSRMPKPWPPTG